MADFEDEIERQETTIRLSDVVREGLDVLGLDCSISQFRTWIAEEYPGWEYNPDTLQTTLSNHKSKRRRNGMEGAVGGEIGSVGMPRGYRGRQGVEEPEELGFRGDGTNLDYSEIGDVIKELRKLSDQVGGVENLRHLLDAIA